MCDVSIEELQKIVGVLLNSRGAELATEQKGLEILTSEAYMKHKLQVLYRKSKQSLPLPDELADYMTLLFQTQETVRRLHDYMTLVSLQMEQILDYMAGTKNMVKSEDYQVIKEAWRHWNSASSSTSGQLRLRIEKAKKEGEKWQY